MLHSSSSMKVTYFLIISWDDVQGQTSCTGHSGNVGVPSTCMALLSCGVTWSAGRQSWQWTFYFVVRTPGPPTIQTESPVICMSLCAEMLFVSWNIFKNWFRAKARYDWALQIYRRLVDLLGLPVSDAQAAAVAALYNFAEINMDCRLRLANERWYELSVSVRRWFGYIFLLTLAFSFLSHWSRNLVLVATGRIDAHSAVCLESTREAYKNEATTV